MPELSERELAIMQALWHQGPMTAQQVRRALRIRLDDSTVRTFLRILERKRHVTHNKRGRSFVFEARTAHDQAARQAVDLLLNRFFNGSLEALLEWSEATPPPTRRGRRRTPARAKERPAEKPPPKRPKVEPSFREEPWLL